MQNALIIGNGIAGSCLAWSLVGLGIDVTVMDAGFTDAASGVAAGIINPITGRRYVKTWMLDELYPFAKDFYKNVEAETGVRVWYDMPILRLLASTKEHNDWCARSGDAAYATWMQTIEKENEWSPLVHMGFEYGLLQGSSRIDFSAFNQLIFNTLQSESRFISQTLDYADIPTLKAEYDCIIFCEGYRARGNPYFTGLPWQVAKGEVLLIELDNPPAKSFEFSLKKEVMLVPIGANKFWVGANYDWAFDGAKPSSEGRTFLIEKLEDMLQVPYTIIDHQAAIRPTAKHYRPFLGRHDKDPQLAIFNGLGTKGALLAPYWAQHLAEHLVLNRDLKTEIHWLTYRKGTSDI